MSTMESGRCERTWVWLLLSSTIEMNPLGLSLIVCHTAKGRVQWALMSGSIVVLSAGAVVDWIGHIEARGIWIGMSAASAKGVDGERVINNDDDARTLLMRSSWLLHCSVSGREWEMSSSWKVVIPLESISSGISLLFHPHFAVLVEDFTCSWPGHTFHCITISHFAASSRTLPRQTHIRVDLLVGPNILARMCLANSVAPSFSFLASFC